MAESTPTVSVVLNSYDQRRLIRDAIESALAQTRGDLELLAVDNGSTDHSVEILAGYAGDPRVRRHLRGADAEMAPRRT
jgi:glycosyltransferase involved in cell wall biosynthesis